MPYNFFEDDDEQARLLEKAIIALTQEQEASKPQVVLYGLDKPYYL